MATLPLIIGASKRRRSSAANKDVFEAMKSVTVRVLTWQQKELIKEQGIRKENPLMSRVETEIYRNTCKHNICIKFLVEGYHHSFRELFQLVEDHTKARFKADIFSALRQEKSLENQQDKLDHIWTYLIKAESAMRSGRWELVYDLRVQLAEYFLEIGDEWISNHFFQTAMDTSFNVHLDGRRREAEAHCNMGLSCERKGEYQIAIDHLEKFNQLSLGHIWTNEEGVTHDKMSCRHLSRISSTIGEKTKDKKLAQSLFLEAHNLAKDGEDLSQVARTALRLGLNFEQRNQPVNAIKFCNEALTAAQDIGDEEMIGEAYHRIGLSYQTKGDMSHAIEYLEFYAKLSHSGGRTLEFIDANQCIASIFNIMGSYDKALEHCIPAYESSEEIHKNIDESSLLLGVIKGNLLFKDYMKNIDLPKKLMMDNIVEWKDNYNNNLGKPLPGSINQLTPSAH